MEFVKLNTKKLDYYMKSNKVVSGLILNSSSTLPMIEEINNSKLDEIVIFWNEDNDYDEETVANGDLYMLLYSSENLDSKKQITVLDKIISDPGPVLNTSRILESSPVDLYLSQYQMDDEFEADKSWPWWWILLIIMAILILILVIILLICCCCCCCCGKKEKNNFRVDQKKRYEDRPPVRNVEVIRYKEEQKDAVEDGFLPPVMVKEGNSSVNNYINGEMQSNGF